MDILEMKTKNKVDNNIEIIRKLFPETVTEIIKGHDKSGNPIYEKAIDFDILKQKLSKVIVEGRKERYQINWPGKKEAILNANSPINKTLRPCRKDSLDFDKTENIYIEGDNLDVLKLLQETYLNKVKMIYIDPPYNTGKDLFVYSDNFAMAYDEFSEVSGQYNEDGNINYDIRKNNESNGKFHSDWINMMYPRLKLARDLLRDDGVIFISIDDHELENLKKICNEIFGEKNFISQLIIASNSAKNNSKYISISHEYVLIYSINIQLLGSEWKVKKNNVDEFVKRVNQLVSRKLSYEEIHNELLELVKYPRFYDFDHYTYVDKKGIFRTDNAGGVTNGNYSTEIIHPKTKKKCVKPSAGWRYKDSEIKKMLKKDMFYFGEDESIIPQPKRYLKDYLMQVPKSILFFDSQSSTKWMKNQQLPFDFAKPIELIEYLISMIPSCNIVLDFFSGSSTTAHAVMKLNAEDGENRKFIMVQIPEICNQKSATYKNICEIGKERIRRAGKKIKKEHPDKAETLDTGFRVLKVDSSNMKDVFYNPVQYKQNLLDNVENNIKEDRSAEDLLFQVMLDLGVLLSSDIKEIEIEGNKVFNVAKGNIIACFDKNITDKIVTEIARMKPFYAVFRDSSLNNDAVATNFEQIFKTYSPNTIRKVL